MKLTFPTVLARRIRIILLFFLSSTVLCHGQILWKISGNGAKDSYLLGSMHNVSYTFCESLNHFDDVLSFVNTVYGECLMLPDSIKTNSSSINAGLMPKGESLNKYYTKEEFEQVKDYCQAAFGNRPNLISLTPVGLILAVNREAMHQSSPLYGEGQESIDIALQIIANYMGKKVKGLEPFDYTNSLSTIGYSDILSGNSIEEQAKSLLVYIKSPENHPDSVKMYYHDLFENYVSQDLSVLEKALGTIADTNSGKEMLYDRSKNWVPTIIEAINQDHTLFVVGAGHLIGKNGLIEILQEEGYELSPLE